MQRFLGGRVAGVAVSLGMLASIILFYRFVVKVNQTTVALTLLLAILAVSTVWGMAVSALTSVVAVVAFNYYFLPPVGTFSIADPQNWIALFAFLVTAVTASELSERARRGTRSAIER